MYIFNLHWIPKTDCQTHPKNCLTKDPSQQYPSINKERWQKKVKLRPAMWQYYLIEKNIISFIDSSTPVQLNNNKQEKEFCTSTYHCTYAYDHF